VCVYTQGREREIGRERERKRGKEGESMTILKYQINPVRKVCVHLCASEKEQKKERERESVRESEQEKEHQCVLLF